MLVGIVTVCIHVMIAIILLMLWMIQIQVEGDGADCHTANLSCAMDPIEEPAVRDTTDDICYAVNRFSLLSIEHDSIVESGVEEISATLADNHSTKSTDSDGSIPSMSCGLLWESSDDGDHSSSQDQLSSCEPTLASFIKPRNSNPLVVSGVNDTIISAVGNLYSVDPGTTKDPD